MEEEYKIKQTIQSPRIESPRLKNVYVSPSASVKKHQPLEILRIQTHRKFVKITLPC